MALPRANRLSLRFERERLTKTGKTSHGQFFTIVSVPVGEIHESPTIPHLAILLSKKTASQAVDRNKIKRTTSAIIEILLPTLPSKDYLIIPKRQVLSENYKVLEEDLRNLILKIGH